MKKNKVSVNYIYNMLYQVLTILTPLITAPILTRTLGATNLGIYDYTFTIVNWFILFGMFGIALYGNREIAKATATNDRMIISKKFSQIFSMQMINLFISLTIFIGILLFVNLPYKNIFIIQAILIFSSAFEISWFYGGIQDFKKVSLRNIGIKLLTVIGIVFLIKDSNDLILYSVFMSAISIINSLILFYKIKEYVDYKRPNLKEIFSHFKGCLILFVPQIATSIYAIFGRTLIGLLYPDISDVAYYNYAYRLTLMVIYIVITIGTVMMPRVVQIRSSGNEEYAKILTNKTLKIALLLSLPLSIGFACVAPFFIPWFLTDAFVKVAYIICILSPTIVLIAITNVFGTQYLISFDQTSKYTISVIVGCVISLIFNFILIRPLGAYGAAITAIMTETTVLIIQYLFVRKVFNFAGIASKFLKYLLLALTMGVAVFVIGICLGIGIITNIIQIFVGAIIYLALLSITKDEIYIFLKNKFFEILFKKKIKNQLN